ncbi:hypothetical protein WT38_17325 [Burkholderia territorii]|nr:hypothetical protein WT38_17325 [Burkholderia territorii]
MALVVLLDASALGLVALLVLRGPRVARLLGDDGVIQPAVGTLHPAAQRAVAHLLPFGDDAAVAGQLREYAIVVGQRRRRHLVPRCAPKQDRRAELIGRRQCRDVAVAQAHDVERHEREVAQIAIRRSERIRDVGHVPSAGRATIARKSSTGER